MHLQNNKKQTPCTSHNPEHSFNSDLVAQLLGVQNTQTHLWTQVRRSHAATITYTGCCVGRRPISLTQGYLTAPRPLKNPALGLTLIFISLWDTSIKNETTACSVFFGGSLKLAFIQPNAIMPRAWSTAIPGAWAGSDPRGEGRTSICSVQYHHSRASHSLLVSQLFSKDSICYL